MCGLGAVQGQEAWSRPGGGVMVGPPSELCVSERPRCNMDKTEEKNDENGLEKNKCLIILKKNKEILN